MPSKTGGESSLYSASFVPSETETARSIAPHHNNQINEIVNVGQSPSGPTLHWDAPVQTERTDTCLGRLYVSRVCVQAVHNVVVTGPQGGGEPTVPAADVNDQPTWATGCCQDIVGDLMLRRRGSAGCPRLEQLELSQ